MANGSVRPKPPIIIIILTLLFPVPQQSPPPPRKVVAPPVDTADGGKKDVLFHRETKAIVWGMQTRAVQVSGDSALHCRW